MGLSVLSLVTGGYQPTLVAPFVPDDRLITIKGSVRDLAGRPIGQTEVFFSPYVSPSFNLQDLLASKELCVLTDGDGGVSTTPQNQVRVLRSTGADRSYVRVRVPVAGSYWVFRMPSDLDLIVLRDLVRTHLVATGPT